MFGGICWLENDVAASSLTSQNRHFHNYNTQKTEMIFSRSVFGRKLGINSVEWFPTNRMKIKQITSKSDFFISEESLSNTPKVRWRFAWINEDLNLYHSQKKLLLPSSEHIRRFSNHSKNFWTFQRRRDYILWIFRIFAIELYWTKWRNFSNSSKGYFLYRITRKSCILRESIKKTLLFQNIQ